MDYTEYTSVKNKFAVNPNLCDLFKLLSIETWKRIEYSFLRQGGRINETTITQNIIFTINAFTDQFGLDIDIFEALDEKRNGNDFELIIKFRKENVEFYTPIQAKKIYKTGKYGAMAHGAQIQSLMDYAALHAAKPLYLLYNFTASSMRPDIGLSNPKELTGCTFISAEHLFNTYYNKRRKPDGTLGWRIPTFYNLNPAPAFGWHELVCSKSSQDLLQFLKVKGIVDNNINLNVEELINLKTDLKQGFYPLNTISVDDNWKNVSELEVPSKEVGVYEIEPTYREIELLNDDNRIMRKGDQDSTEREKVYKEFSPKSRIVISK